MKQPTIQALARWVFASCAAAFLLAGLTAAVSGPKPTITAAESRGLIFQHGLHTDLECLDCHQAAKTATTGWADLLPGHSVCLDCHDVEDENECAACHMPGAPEDAPGVINFSPKFSHAAHADAGLACSECHVDLDGPLPTDMAGHFPYMTECMACHTEKLVSNDCNLCHLPDEDLVPPDHKLDWLNLHGIAAAESQTACVQCHSVADDCQACHNGDAVSSPHPRNYVARHGHDAHLSDMACGVCHDQRSFCNECHSAYNILPADHFRPGWANSSGGDHADAAKFDLESCMACHDTPGQSPVCANCHGE